MAAVNNLKTISWGDVVNLTTNYIFDNDIMLPHNMGNAVNNIYNQFNGIINYCNDNNLNINTDELINELMKQKLG